MSTGKTRTRSRVTPLPKSGSILLGKYERRTNLNSPWVPATDPPSASYDTTGLAYPGLKAQITRDETHSGPPYREGGPFRSLTIVSCEPFAPVVGYGTYYRLDGLRRYIGGFRPPTNSQWGTDLAVTPYSSTLSLNSPHFPAIGTWGDKAYNKTKPKLEKAGVGVALAELRDMPRMALTSSKFFHEIWKKYGGSRVNPMAPKKAADHFLNHQFGWVPFLSDMKRIIYTYQDSTEHINRLTAENGRWIRKRVTLAEEKSYVFRSWTQGVGLFPNTSFTSSFAPWLPLSETYWTVFDEVTTSIKASGRFRYYRPEFDATKPDYSSALNNVARQMSLYGVRVSPSNIYKATPWTWAIDWFSNVGDYVDRANDYLVDSITAQYLYLMQHQTIRRVFMQVLPFNTGTVVLRFERLIDTKQRTEASSPYGFSLSWDQLTPRQVAIAGALGISRW